MNLRTIGLRLFPVAALALHVGDAAACGCFAPPISSEDFAVNQQAEQIIFEVRQDTISAHVRILYQGDPEQFAWLLPLPSVPELELSNSLLFSMIDNQTAPIVQGWTENICPEPRYACRVQPSCALLSNEGGGYGYGNFDAGASSDDGAPKPRPAAVEVLATQRIGSYDTVTFAADEAGAAVEWLNENGFIINETMSPYMQPYLDEGMVFIASKLIPGADLNEIRPLRMTYESSRPSIPLQLTAIAAEPHMMVTSFIYADERYEPAYLPIVTVPEEELVADGRNNYPMLLSRIVDEAGGSAFVEEYSGPGPRFTDDNGCCTSEDEEGDWCSLGDDEQCQCPGTEFDAGDCADEEELVEAASLLNELRHSYSTFTRLSSRVSPEEMTFNPEFVPAQESATLRGPLRLSGTVLSLRSCEAEILDEDEYDAISLSQECATTYCDLGDCVVTKLGAGCECAEGAAARVFTDSDGLPSLTCVPDKGTVDFSAGGLELPDACAGIDVDDGECVDVGGFPSVVCEDGMAASFTVGSAVAQCAAIDHHTGEPGARNYSRQLEELDVCAPPAPSCPPDGWLVDLKDQVSRPGVSCHDAPDPSWFEQPPARDCSEADDDAPEDEGVTTSDAQGSGAAASDRDTTDPVADASPNDDADAEATTLPAGHLDTTKPRPEPSGRSRPFCGITGVGERQGGAFAALLFGAALVFSRRRASRSRVPMA